MSPITPFSLQGLLPGKGVVNHLATRFIEQVSGLGRLQQMYRELPPTPPEDVMAFLHHALAKLQVDYRVPRDELARIPLQGPTLVVANHPFGAIEGVVLAHLLRGLRSDVRIMANTMLQRIPALQPLLIGVDLFGPDRITGNQRALRQAIQWLRQGGLLLLFPAGAVSHLQIRTRQVTDPTWQPLAARLIRHTDATTVPIHIAGCNGALFQAAGLIHPLLRTALLPRALLRQAGHTLSLRIGAPLRADRLRQMGDDLALIAQLRLRTYLLQPLSHSGAEGRETHFERPRQPLIAPIPASRLAAEVAALPAEQQLICSGEFVVYHAASEQIPHLLREIGRLRELTFRAVGEGSGHALDLDLYDNYYHHLFLWQQQKRELVGAYRLGLGDQIAARFGKRGFYTHSLFRYRRQLLDRINPALELGRSFISPTYQRSFSPLLLLWKGIGAFVAAHPRYRILFGPVSISNDYQSLSRQLMVQFLQDQRMAPELARLVKPRQPFRDAAGDLARPEYAGIQDIEALSELISQIEGDAKGAPILLKQYLKLGGQLLGFNIDRQFGNALDGLIMVDLLATDQKVLQRYMGSDGAAHFIAWHQASRPPQRHVG